MINIIRAIKGMLFGKKLDPYGDLRFTDEENLQAKENLEKIVDAIGSNSNYSSEFESTVRSTAAEVGMSYEEARASIIRVLRGTTRPARLLAVIIAISDSGVPFGVAVVAGVTNYMKYYPSDAAF